jgi:ketosteroid isomerase-like protein
MMNKPVAVVAVVLSALIIFGCQSEQQKAESNLPATSTATQNKPDPKVVEEVKATLAKHDKALNDKNIEAVMSTFSTNPNTVMLGTGQGERFVGQQAIKEAYTEIFKDYDPGTLISNCDWKTGETDAAGTTAWLAATCKLQDSMKNKKRDYVLNVSGALEKQDGDWRFVMLHMSNSTSSGPPPAVATKASD